MTVKQRSKPGLRVAVKDHNDLATLQNKMIRSKKVTTTEEACKCKRKTMEALRRMLAEREA